MEPWFSFSARDFAYSFTSILLEGIPFLLIGTLVSGWIDRFLPPGAMTRFLPRNAYAGIAVSALLGLVFPMCECAVVPVIRRLIGKGFPVSNAVAYMLAAPVVNPIVAVATLAAFRGQGAVEMTMLRLGVGWMVAVIAGMAVHNLALHHVLRPSVLLTAVSPAGSPRTDTRGSERWRGALGVAANDFLDVSFFFILGAGAAAFLGTAVNQTLLLPFAMEPALAVGSMMALAVLLSLCSTSDAFVAATFVMFPAVAKLAFLVLGPMIDLKLLFLYSSVFTRRFVAGLAIGLYILVGLICLRLTVLGL